MKDTNFVLYIKKMKSLQIHPFVTFVIKLHSIKNKWSNIFD